MFRALIVYWLIFLRFLTINNMTKKNQQRKKIGFITLIIIGLLIGLAIKHVAVGLIIGLIFGLLASGMVGGKKDE